MPRLFWKLFFALWLSIMAFVAVIFASINVVGGFLVTGRMLKMFQRK